MPSHVARLQPSAKRLARERLEMTIPQEVAETLVDPKAYAEMRQEQRG